MTRHSLMAALVELVTVVFTLVVISSFGRVFDSGEYVTPLVGVAIATHAILIALRRLGLATMWAVSASLIIASLTLFGLLWAPITGAVLPGPAVWSQIQLDLNDAWSVFESTQAPVQTLRGFIAIAAISVWTVAVMADWAALRLRSGLEAVSTGLVVFGFLAILGDRTEPIRHAVVFAAVAGAVVLVTHLSKNITSEPGRGPGRLTSSMTPAVLGVGAVAMSVAIAAVAGPRLPQDQTPIFDPSDLGQSNETRFVTSPLVDISANLVNQTASELFSVVVDNPTTDRFYWRQMALTDFDGTQWRRSSSFQNAQGAVGSTLNESQSTMAVRQTVTTTRLGGIYLPAAFEVSEVIASTNVNGEPVGLEYEVSTGALVIDQNSEVAASAGVTYTIESAVPVLDGIDLPAVAGADLDADELGALTALPAVCGVGQSTLDGCWNPMLTELAERLTEGLDDDYARVLALQAFFLDPANFTYDLNVSQTHSVASMEDFVTTVRRGYCEQFAATFTALARSLGIPARVAVGFTWGDWDEQRGAFVVRGEHAHAWPEVYFAGVGWVTFDPTPGRAPANNTAISGAGVPQQAGGADPLPTPEADSADLPTETEPSTTPAPSETDQAGQPLDPTDDLDPLTDPVDQSDESGIPQPIVAVMVAVAAYAAVLGAAALLRRRRRLTLGRQVGGQAAVAWGDATDALGLIDLRHRDAETPTEFARRAQEQGVDVGPLSTLATLVTQVGFDSESNTADAAEHSQELADQVVDRARAQASRSRLIRNALTPRKN